MIDPKNQKLNDRFFSDPEWANVEAMLFKHIEELKNMSTIDLKQPAEHVKAELIGRQLAYEGLLKFLNDTRFVHRPLPENTNHFK